MRRSRYTVYVLMTLMAGLVLVTAGCGAPVQEEAREARDLNFTLNDLEGNPVSLTDSDGQVRIVDFWATWCAPCKEEVPMYKELHDEYGDRGVRIISISMDYEEDLNSVKEFVAKYEIQYTSLMDDGEVSRQYGAEGLPATYLIDQQGRMVKSFIGVKPKRVLVNLIEGLLADGAGEAGP